MNLSISEIVRFAVLLASTHLCETILESACSTRQECNSFPAPVLDLLARASLRQDNLLFQSAEF